MKTKQGSGLIFAVVLLFVILGMVITLSSITVLETKMSQKTKSSVGAFYNSESGVEWALNKIATTTASNITGAFGNPSSGVSPTGVTDYKVYLLKADGKVITDGSTLISDIKAVRSVGTQGGETQRAIEAAVAAGACPSGFTDITKMGRHLGCIETNVHNGGEIVKWWTAADTCFADVGGRIPYWSEWYIASKNFSLNHHTTIPYEWLGEGPGDPNAYFGLSVWYGNAEDPKPRVSAAQLNDAVPYRCWIPND